MKRLITIGAAVVFLGPWSVFAQTESSMEKFSLAPAVGVFFPQDKDFNDTYLAGFGGGVTVGYRLSPIIQVFAALDFQSHKLNKELFSSVYSISGGNFGIISVIPGVKIYLPAMGRFEIYGLAGAGMFLTSVGEMTVSAPGYQGLTYEKQSETNFGFIFGGGAEFLLTERISLLGEVRWTSILPGSGAEDDDSSLRHLSVRFGPRLIL